MAHWLAALEAVAGGTLDVQWGLPAPIVSSVPLAPERAWLQQGVRKHHRQVAAQGEVEGEGEAEGQAAESAVSLRTVRSDRPGAAL